MENKKDKLKNIDLLENFGLQLDMGGKSGLKKKKKERVIREQETNQRRKNSHN